MQTEQSCNIPGYFTNVRILSMLCHVYKVVDGFFCTEVYSLLLVAHKPNRTHMEFFLWFGDLLVNKPQYHVNKYINMQMVEAQ